MRSISCHRDVALRIHKLVHGCHAVQMANSLRASCFTNRLPRPDMPGCARCKLSLPRTPHTQQKPCHVLFARAFLHLVRTTWLLSCAPRTRTRAWRPPWAPPGPSFGSWRAPTTWQPRRTRSTPPPLPPQRRSWRLRGANQHLCLFFCQKQALSYALVRTCVGFH